MIGSRDGRGSRPSTARSTPRRAPTASASTSASRRRIEEALDTAGDSLAGFYHSHTGSPARPSPTDIRMMSTFFGPPYVHIVVSIANRERPDVRVFHIEDGAATEQEYTLEP